MDKNLVVNDEFRPTLKDVPDNAYKIDVHTMSARAHRKPSYRSGNLAFRLLCLRIPYQYPQLRRL